MPKGNSLKLVPFAPRKRTEGHYDQARGEYVIDKVLFDGLYLMEYTVGSPGEQTTAGWNHRTQTGTRIDWRDNEPFEATLRIDRLERGRSAARFWFVDEDNQIEYPFFGQGLVDMLTDASMRNGYVRGTWIAVKRGSNYGIEMVK